MLREGAKSIKTWIVVYAGFMAAIVFAETGVAMPLQDVAALSPIILEADKPALSVESIVRRSDI